MPNSQQSLGIWHFLNFPNYRLAPLVLQIGEFVADECEAGLAGRAARGER